MKEWFVYCVAGACTAFGVVQAATAAHVQSTFFGCGVLGLMAGLYWLNSRIDDAGC